MIGKSSGNMSRMNLENIEAILPKKAKKEPHLNKPLKNCNFLQAFKAPTQQVKYKGDWCKAECTPIEPAFLQLMREHVCVDVSVLL